MRAKRAGNFRASDRIADRSLMSLGTLERIGLLQRFTVGLKLEVEAETGQLAIETARTAGLSLQDQPGVAHASMDSRAVPLFDSQPFAQIRGQLGMGS